MGLRRAIVPAALFVALGALCYRFMDLLGDSFWSIASGRYVLEHGLPQGDPMSYTATGERWIVHMPLCQVAFAWIADGLPHRLGIPTCLAGAVPPAPPWALLLLEAFAALVEGAALSLLLSANAETHAEKLVGLMLSAGLLVVQSGDLAVRGQVFGDLAWSVLLVWIGRVRDGRRVPWWASLLLASAWINLHSSCFLAVFVPAFYALLTGLSKKDRPQAGPFLIMAVAAAAGLLMNPYGVLLPLDLMKLMSSRSTRAIDLFLPPAPGSPTVALSFLFLFGVAWSALRAPAARIDGFSLIALTCASATSRRFLPLALMFGVAIGLRRAREWPRVRIRAGWPLGAAAVLTVIGLAKNKDPYRDVPMAEVADIERLALPDHVSNPYFWGGYLDYAWNGRRKTFIDGRNQLFDGGAFAASCRLSAGVFVDETLWAYRVNTVLDERGGTLAEQLRNSPNWRVASAGRIGLVLTRTVPIKVADEGAPPTRDFAR